MEEDIKLLKRDEDKQNEELKKLMTMFKSDPDFCGHDETSIFI